MSERSVSFGAGERLLEDLLADVYAAAPLDLSGPVKRYAESLGLEHVMVYLVDVQQKLLVPLADGEAPLEVDSSLAGWAYRTVSLRVSEEEEEGALTAWLPLVDGAERLGVLGIRAPVIDGPTLRRCRMLGSLLAMAVISKRAYSDSFAQRTRTSEMQLPAEMIRALLPPRTIGSEHVISTGVLEPAYEVGGDAFDHSLTQHTLNAVILDGMGHDLTSGLTTSVGIAGCRNARRAGAELPQLVDTVDETLAHWLPDRFCTGVVAQLDLLTGALRWCNCGHPQPLLIRGRKVVDRAMERPPEPPMGLPARLAGSDRRVHGIDLEAGDRVLLYTDGVTEARSVSGEEFGLDRFTDFVIRAGAAGERAPEVLRLLIHAILEHQNNDLSDDATILMIEWRPPRS